MKRETADNVKTAGHGGRHLLALAVCLLGMQPLAMADNLFWDPNGESPGTGGTGAWNLTDLFWRLDSDTGALQTYTNSVGNMTANFGGTAGTVTIAPSTTINANLINFTVNYTIAGGAGRFLNLDGTAPTISVSTGTSTISAIITGSNGLNKTGAGLLTLSGANTYSGATTASEGILRAADGVGLSSNSNLVLNGGVYQASTNNFIRSLGTGANQVSITGGTTGFGSADGQTRIIAIGGIDTPTDLVWGTTHFNPDVFVLNNNGFSGTAVDFRNAIDLNEADRTIRSTGGTVFLRGDITGSGGLSKTGGGTIVVSGNNTFDGGFTWVDASTYTLILGSDTALGGGLVTLNSTTGAVTVRAENATDRVLTNDVNIVENDLIFGSAVTGNLTFGHFTKGSGGQNIQVLNEKTTFASYTATGGTFQKNGTGGLIIAGNFTRSGTDTFQVNNGALAVAGTWNVGAAARLGAASTTGHLGRNGTLSANLGAAQGVTWTGSTASGGLFAYGSNATWGGAGNNLVVNFGGSGAELTWGTTAGFVGATHTLYLGHELSNGTVDFQNAINFNAADRTIQVDAGATNLGGGSDAILSGVLSNGGLIKTGDGQLELTAQNTYRGNTVINAGTLLVAEDARLEFEILGSGVNNSISGTGSLLLDGEIFFDLDTAAAVGSWMIVDVDTLSVDYGSTFTVVGFTETLPDSGIWQFEDYTFTESTGLLTAVPEPSAAALFLAAGAVLLRRRRR